MPRGRGRGRSGRGAGRGRGRAREAADESVRPSKAKQTPWKPEYMERMLQDVDGPRYKRRPSYLARIQNKRRSSDVLHTDELSDEGEGAWNSHERMPEEPEPGDEGWQPGPIRRPLPRFNGPSPGPTNKELKADSTEEQILKELITDEFKQKCHEFTIAHMWAWRRAHARDGKGYPKRIEHAFGKSLDRLLDVEDENCQKRFSLLFDTWVAAKLRIAQLKPELKASALWGRLPLAISLEDVQLSKVLTYEQFKWCNRHMSFAQVEDNGSDSGAEEDDEDDSDAESSSSEPIADADEADAEASHTDSEESAMDPEEDFEPDTSEPQQAPLLRKHDTYRKWRELTDIVNAAFAKAYNPSQHLGLDEATRSTKHWDKRRIKFKASVHSGSLVDSLNDCRSSYCMWFEEQRWLSKHVDGPNVGKLPSRLKRAAKCLIEKKHDANGRSTSNYCISLDRGYGSVEAQEFLWKDCGIYSNAMMQSNRRGLPRALIKVVQSELKSCPRQCRHRRQDAECRKYMWTVVHRPPFELSMWQDSKLILCYGNFFSCNRVGLLSRGVKKHKESNNIWAPENVFHYNIEGRSATDSSDQSRRKMAMAERRITRAGHKGMSFVLDLAFTNAAAMQRDLQPQNMSRQQLDTHFTKVAFCLRWANSVFSRAEEDPFRRYNTLLPSGSGGRSSSRTPMSRLPFGSGVSGGSSGVLQIAKQHVLKDMYADALAKFKAEQVPKRGRPSKKRKTFTYGRGYCGEYDVNTGKFRRCGLVGEDSRSALMCQQCKRYFHLSCFFAHHYCGLMA